MTGPLCRLGIGSAQVAGPSPQPPTPHHTRLAWAASAVGACPVGASPFGSLPGQWFAPRFHGARWVSTGWAVESLRHHHCGTPPAAPPQYLRKGPRHLCWPWLGLATGFPAAFLRYWAKSLSMAYEISAGSYAIHSKHKPLAGGAACDAVAGR